MTRVLECLCAVAIAVCLAGCSESVSTPASPNQGAQESQGSDTTSQDNNAADGTTSSGSDSR